MTVHSHENDRYRRSRRGTDNGQPGSPMLPPLPLPSPDLCLLNSRPLSCLYSESHEHSHRKRVRQALLKAESEHDDTSQGHITACADTHDTDIASWPPASCDISKDLRLFEDLISYIGLRIANKRNALATVGIDLGSVEKGFGLLERACRYGVPCLPMHALVKTLQTRKSSAMSNRDSKSGRKPSKLRATDLSDLLEDPDKLWGDLSYIISDSLNITSKDRYEKPFLLRSLSQLPVIDNKMLSILSPLSVALSQDKLLADLLGPTVWTELQQNERMYQDDEKTEPISLDDSCFKSTSSGTTDKLATSSGNNSRVRPSAGDKTDNLTTATIATRTASNTDSSITKSKTATKGKTSERTSKSARLPTVDDLNTEPKSDGNLMDTTSSGAGDTSTPAGNVNNQSSTAEKPVVTPESDLTVDQMVQNLLDGKLCNGSEAKSARELGMSILVAGMYEFLSVDFFKEFLQDRRLVECFHSHDKEALTKDHI
ncbi:UPF0609 CG1218, putative [Babesia ovis]|uniref:UPF0609 CG1218, putative n=1 Tax=Babesia ovis TaxID=5869 RepID=A0A9W5T8H7_BABOV|nr:UPF0609 CG1218, putative [Babesia ovis]